MNMNMKIIVPLALILAIIVIAVVISFNQLTSEDTVAQLAWWKRTTTTPKLTTTTPKPTTTLVPTTTPMPTTTKLTTTTIPNSCNDTDGGQVYTVKGTVSGYYYGLPYSKTDLCNSTTMMTEYYCSGVSLNLQIWDCNNATYGTTQCTDGACI
jgi:hypothetical protein